MLQLNERVQLQRITFTFIVEGTIGVMRENNNDCVKRVGKGRNEETGYDPTSSRSDL